MCDIYCIYTHTHTSGHHQPLKMTTTIILSSHDMKTTCTSLCEVAYIHGFYILCCVLIWFQSRTKIAGNV